MQFSTTIAVAVFGVTTHALTLPSSVKRQSSPVDVLQADISNLQAEVSADLGDISKSTSSSIST